MFASKSSRRAFVGRSRERRILADRIADAARGRASLVLLRGPAGSGKSRLLDEAMADAHAASVRDVRIACDEFATNAHAPLLALFAALDRADVAARFERRANGDEGETLAKIRRSETLVSTLDEASRATPLAVAIDDAHWSDLATLELLGGLERALAGRVVVVVAYRDVSPEDDWKRARMIANLERGSHRAISLDPLSRDETIALLEAIVDERGVAMDRAPLHAIADRSDGLPLVAEALLETRLAHPDDPLRLPQSLASSIRERLALFSSRERHVLEAAAALGQMVDIALLARICASDERDVLVVLQRAKTLGILDDVDARTVRFHHALTRDATYTTLLRAQRRTLHAKIAAELDGDARAAPWERAFHLWAAGDATQGFRENVALGDAAADAFAWFDALGFYERAYDVADDAERRTEVEGKLATALFALGDLATAREWLERAETSARARGLRDVGQRYALRLAGTLAEAGERARAVERALAIADEIGDADVELAFEARVRAADYLLLRLDSDGASRELALAAPQYDRAPARWRSTFEMVSGKAAQLRRDAPRARDHFARAIDLAKTVDDRPSLARAIVNAADFEVRGGEIDAARAAFARGLDVARAIGATAIEAFARVNLALIETYRCDLAAAREHLAAAPARTRSIAFTRLLYTGVALRVASLAGETVDIDAARAEAERALEEGTVAGLGVLVGALALARPEHARTMNHLMHRTIERLHPFNGPFWLADAASREAGDALAQVARAWLSPAATDVDSLGRAYLDLIDGRLARTRGERRETAACAKAAAARFRARGLPFDEARAHELAGDPRTALALYRTHRLASEIARLRSGIAGPRDAVGDVPRLSAREREIGALLVRGLSAREIAGDLTISVRTVESHVANLYDKLGVRTRREFADLAADLFDP